MISKNDRLSSPDTVVVLAFDGMTALDAIGPAEVFNLCRYTTTIWACAHDAPFVTTDAGLRLQTENDLESSFDQAAIIVVPGGPGQEEMMHNEHVAQALRNAKSRGTTISSVCTGSLILAAAGLLTDSQCTGHWTAEHRLRALGSHYRTERVVRDKQIWTSAGVSAGIELGIQLVGFRYGKEEAARVQTFLEYFPDSGSLPARSISEVSPDIIRTMMDNSRHNRFVPSPAENPITDEDFPEQEL